MDADDDADFPPLKELSPDEVQEREKKIRKLRLQLELLLKKIRQSQILKENTDHGKVGGHR